MPLNTSNPECLFYGPLSASEADLVSIPSGETWLVRQIEVSNDEAQAHTFTLKHVPDGDTSGPEHVIAFPADMPIDVAPKMLRASGNWVCAFGKLRGFADEADQVYVRVDGVRIVTT
jgi:hypothetical protein